MGGVKIHEERFGGYVREEGAQARQADGISRVGAEGGGHKHFAAWGQTQSTQQRDERGCGPGRKHGMGSAGYTSDGLLARLLCGCVVGVYHSVSSGYAPKCGR